MLVARVLERAALPDVQRVMTRRLIAVGVERCADPLAERHVPGGVEHSLRPHQREINVQENGVERHLGATT